MRQREGIHKAWYEHYKYICPTFLIVHRQQTYIEAMASSSIRATAYASYKSE